MLAQTLWVPFSVLNAPEHRPNTRLVWLLLCLHPAGTSSALAAKLSCRLSGLDPETVADARARLAKSPLGACYAHRHRSCAALPAGLLASSGLSASARLLYGQLQGVPGFAGQDGSFRYAALTALTGSCADALRRAVAELSAAGWLDISQKHRKSPLEFTLRDPTATQMRARLSSVRRRVRGAANRGEAVLRKFLDLLVADDDYEDDADPDFLLNPYTNELMELDRYYLGAAVAFEFQGDQHYEETDLATFDQTVKQVGRDAMKAFICKAQGIELVIIHPQDLSLKALEQKIPSRLSRRSLEGCEPLVVLLEGLASEYRERTEDERARRARR